MLRWFLPGVTGQQHASWKKVSIPFNRVLSKYRGDFINGSIPGNSMYRSVFSPHSEYALNSRFVESGGKIALVSKGTFFWQEYVGEFHDAHVYGQGTLRFGNYVDCDLSRLTRATWMSFFKEDLRRMNYWQTVTARYRTTTVPPVMFHASATPVTIRLGYYLG